MTNWPVLTEHDAISFVCVVHFTETEAVPRGSSHSKVNVHPSREKVLLCAPPFIIFYTIVLCA